MTNFGFIKIASLSPRVTVANPAANISEALGLIKKAENDGCQAVCLPELYVSGYSCGDLFLNETLIKKCEEALGELVDATAESETIIIVGAPVEIGPSLYNCAVVIQGGHISGVVPKMYLSNSNGFSEKRQFSSGYDCTIKEITLCGEKVPFGKLLFDAGEFTFGVEICEDLWVPVSPSSSMALNGASVIFNLAASNEILTKDEIREGLVRQQSSKCICAYVMASAGAGESTTDFVFSGDCIIAENGKILARSNRFSQESGYITACVDTNALKSLRKQSSFGDNFNGCGISFDYTHVKLELPSLCEKDVNRAYSARPFIPDDEKTRTKRCMDALDIQCAGLVKRMTHTHINKLILGASGGLDSTLALLVAHKAIKLLGLPEENLICITMPGFGTTDRTYTNAVELIKATGAQFREIDIKAACIQHMSDIGHDVNNHDITYENTQARERTQILMDIANKEGALLVGTGDLSEMALGWCTYNGDHMSMYGVNAGIPKTLVRHIVKYVADNSDDSISSVLNRVLDTPVSPELLPPDEQGRIAQKTEDKLGPYEVHDFYIYHFIRFGFTPEKLLFIATKAFGDAYSKEQLSDWLKLFLRRFFINQFKRSCVPDSPKVGTIGLSPRGDWAMPSDADFSAWLG